MTSPSTCTNRRSALRRIPLGMTIAKFWKQCCNIGVRKWRWKIRTFKWDPRLVVHEKCHTINRTPLWPVGEFSALMWSLNRVQYWNRSYPPQDLRSWYGVYLTRALCILYVNDIVLFASRRTETTKKKNWQVSLTSFIKCITLDFKFKKRTNQVCTTEKSSRTSYIYNSPISMKATILLIIISHSFRFENGFEVILGRGLDYFLKRTMAIEFDDWNERKCRKCRVTISIAKELIPLLKKKGINQ